MIKIRIRLYEELNIYLPVSKRKTWIDLSLDTPIPIFKVLKSLNIPLEKIDLILNNDMSVDFNSIVRDGDRIAVYPVFELFDISEVTKLRSKPLRNPKFICDVHLGKLCKYLRILGFDTLFDNSLELNQLIERSRKEHRILLSRNNQLSKLYRVTHFYRVRSAKTNEQLMDLINKMDLYSQIKAFTRCLQCNNNIEPVDKSMISNQLPAKTLTHFNEFYICHSCHKIYWKGSHYKRMLDQIDKLLSH